MTLGHNETPTEVVKNYTRSDIQGSKCRGYGSKTTGDPAVPAGGQIGFGNSIKHLCAMAVESDVNFSVRR